MTGLMATDDISPELALVSPELSAEERERLPERPWEEAAGRATQPPATREAGRPLRGAERSEVRPHGVSGLATRARRRRQTGVFLALALVSASVVGLSSPWGGSDPEVPPTPTAPGRSVQLSSGPPRLLPNAGYVVSPRGSFLTARSGRSIATFTVPLRCDGRDLVIRDIPVSGRSFQVTRTPSRRIRVRLEGRVLDGQQVAGTVAAVGGDCARRRVSFRARVS